MRTPALMPKCLPVLVLLSMTLLAAAVGPVEGAQRVDIVVGADAPSLEQFAARELQSQFKRLFDAEITLGNSAPAASGNLVLVGSPTTNPALKASVGKNFPKLSEQGIALKSFQNGQQSGIVVGGGSPVATLWAAYELGHRFGIRYLFRGDIYPGSKVALKLGGFDIVQEPTLKLRTWRTVNDFAIGPESWPLADHQKFLKQLAKMKFNRVMISVYPWQPFVHYEFGDVKKQTAMLWFGEKYPVDGDTPGRAAFGGAKHFENPDFAGKTTYSEMVAAGTEHLRGIIAASHELGMSVGISISPLEFPREFAAILPGAKVATGLKNLTVTPGAQQDPHDKTLSGLLKTKIRAYLDTYPEVDALYLTMPEFPEWHEHAEAAWKELGQGSKASLDELVEAARNRNLIASGERGEQSVKGNLVTLALLNRLLSDPALLTISGGRKVKPVISSVDPALFGVLDRVIADGHSVLHFIDYTARRIVENGELLERVPADKVPSSLILTLADDNVGILSQSATRRIGTLVTALQKNGWQGFSTRYWLPAELDATVHYLSRAAFDPSVTVRSAHDDLFVAITGKQSAADRLWLCFGHIEAATELIDENDLGFAFPVKGMLMRHYRSDPAPEWWAAAIEHYTQAMIELYRSHDAVEPRARPLLYYYAKRSEYVLDYFNSVKSLRESAIAGKQGQGEQAIEHIEQAVESMYNAIDTLGDIARDQSDRGLIAVLNAYGYRPLLAEYERMLDAEDSK